MKKISSADDSEVHQGDIALSQHLGAFWGPGGLSGDSGDVVRNILDFKNVGSDKPYRYPYSVDSNSFTRVRKEVFGVSGHRPLVHRVPLLDII